MRSEHEVVELVAEVSPSEPCTEGGSSKVTLSSPSETRFGAPSEAGTGEEEANLSTIGGADSGSCGPKVFSRNQVSEREYCSSVEEKDDFSTNIFQLLGTVPERKLETVVKLSSKTTWYWGETCPVDGLRTSATEPKWRGECPR